MCTSLRGQRRVQAYAWRVNIPGVENIFWVTSFFRGILAYSTVEGYRPLKILWGILKTLLWWAIVFYFTDDLFLISEISTTFAQKSRGFEKEEKSTKAYRNLLLREMLPNCYLGVPAIADKGRLTNVAIHSPMFGNS